MAHVPAAGGAEAERGCTADPRGGATPPADSPAAAAPQLGGEDVWSPTQLQGLQMAPPSRLGHAGLLGGQPHSVQGDTRPGL